MRQTLSTVHLATFILCLISETSLCHSLADQGKVAQIATASECNVSQADILMILDSSGSVSSANFRKMLKFIIELIDEFDIGKDGVQVSVTLFASKVIEKIHLNAYHDKQSLKTAINAINRTTGSTNTGEALLRARTISLLPKYGARPNIPKIAIVITDGKSQDSKKTAEQANQLRRVGVVVFAVGIGPGVKSKELQTIATGPGSSHVFHVQNFNGLDSIKKELTTKTCEAQKYTVLPVVSTTEPSKTISCNKTIADIVFALDTSASVSMSDFQNMLNFVQQIIHSFDVGEAYVRVGVVTFSGRSVLQFHLNKYFNMNQLRQAISNIKYLAGSTNTADALRYISTTSFLKVNGERDNVPNIVIVITDGKSNVPLSTAIEAAKLKAIATVFSIGIGNLVVQRELKAIASDDNHVFTVNNFAALSEIKHSLATKTCEVSGGKEPDDFKKCPAKADIVFILDSSGSIGKVNFKKILKFVQSISKSFNVDPEEVQIGIDSFDSKSRTEFSMNKYKNLQSLLDAINKINVHFGWTHMGKALKRLREESMTAAAGARSNVTHIGILITDGRHNGPLNVISEAKKVRESGIKLFALGIGPRVNYQQLREIANQPANKYVFKAENFDTLKSIVPILSQESCKVAPVKEDIVCSLAADIVFVVDSSGSVGKRNFKTMLSFINSLVGKFVIGPQTMQVGILRYNSRNYLEFNLNKYKNKTQLQEAINNVHYTGGNTATGEALSFLHYNMFSRANGYRKGVPKIAIVITDGISNRPRKTRDEAEAAQKDNITMFAIGIGKKVNKAELRAIASQPSSRHMFNIKDFLALETIVNSLANKTCKEIPKDSKPLTCRDKIPRCHEFKPEVCHNYQRWSHDFCPHYCGMCFTSLKCMDEAPTCHLLETKNCEEFPAWSRENCAKSCGYCGTGGNNTGIGDKVYTCSYKGKKYQTGESWKDGCDYECSCLDAQRGMYSCWNRCPIYFNLPPQCKLLNIEEKCCKEPVCNFDGQISRTNGHKKGKRFGVDVCIYEGREYYQEQSWSIGCEADCICKDAKSGFWSCTSRCPHYNNLPPNCYTISKAGQCCKEVKCEFTIDFGRLKGHGKVVDKVIPVSNSSCVDQRPCEELTSSICHAKDLEFWVVKNCPLFCNKCPNSTITSKGACLIDGKAYKVGEIWKQTCSLTCMCEDGHHGIARCFDICAKFPNLPSNCRKVKIPGDCCEKLICENGTLTDSHKMNQTVDGNVVGGNQSQSHTQMGCMYKESYYEPNQTWTDGCQWRCKCVNGNKGLYKCSQRCPTFNNLPSICHLENIPGDPCCQMPVCTKNSSLIIPSYGKGLIGKGEVTDSIKEGCIYQNKTHLDGEEWIDECNYFCKCTNRGKYVCHERCEKIKYIPDNCYVVHNPKDDCCEMLVCTNTTIQQPETPTTPATVGKCYYKGETYKQGDTWYDECSLQCFCEDAMTGYYRCLDRCYSFTDVPADCIMKQDPNDSNCCHVFDCGKKDHGLIGNKLGFGKSLQPDNKYKDRCVYKQKFYMQEEEWNDGCEMICKCQDAKRNMIKCHSSCELYHFLPENCKLDTPQSNGCCPVLNCSTQQKECKDENELCSSFGSDACQGDYKDFAKLYCQKTCGLCTPALMSGPDKIPHYQQNIKLKHN